MGRRLYGPINQHSALPDHNALVQSGRGSGNRYFDQHSWATYFATMAGSVTKGFLTQVNLNLIMYK